MVIGRQRFYRSCLDTELEIATSQETGFSIKLIVYLIVLFEGYIVA